MSTTQESGPRFVFASVHRVGSPPPAAVQQVLSKPKLVVELLPGPLQIPIGVMVDLSGPGVACAIMRTQVLQFPEGSYLVVQQEVEFDGLGQAQSQARVLNAEVAAVCDMLLPGWIKEKLFEGAVESCVPEGPKTFRSWTAKTVGEIQQLISTGYADLDRLPEAVRERFQLMSRWYRKAAETDNLVDCFLFLYMALEVFPSQGTADVPKHVRDLLSASAFKDLKPGIVKERLQLGRLAGTRARIVHDGKSVVTNAEWGTFTEQLRVLEALASECLNLLAGRPYSGQLDFWVRV